ALANGTIRPEDSGIRYGELNLTQNELDMLTAMIYCESRGESYEGQLAVGYVIMNRVRSSKFPNSLEAVLSAPRQFEPYGSGRFNIVLTAYWEDIPGVIHESSWKSCQKAAMVCVNSDSNVGESLFFRTHKPVPQLAENLEAAGVPYWIIGNHIFYYSWVNY
ncbi:MAG: cell wall hydrolase, partial [Anaerotignum sp.]|nr:cell wall hydrolase [Anaerotignum sp.]